MSASYSLFYIPTRLKTSSSLRKYKVVWWVVAVDGGWMFYHTVLIDDLEGSLRIHTGPVRKLLLGRTLRVFWWIVVR
jgi:hypothetical protein